MKLTKTIESKVLKVYDTWLDSYLNGDVKTYDFYLDNHYRFIGSTNNEEFLNRKDTTKFFANTADQLAGKCDLRNDNRIIEQFGELIFITHIFDAWFHNGTDYSYYGRFRFSSTLRKNEEGWRFIYQHFSTTDSKAQEGETIGFDQVSAENIQLREAIKRRTTELEQKNRELEIESALERVRARSLIMLSSDELLETSDVMLAEINKLNINAMRIGICTINAKTEAAEIWSRSETNRPVENKILGVVPKGVHSVFDNMVKAWKQKIPFYTNTRKGMAVADYYKKVSEYLSYPLPAKYNKQETISCFFFPEGALNVVSFQPLNEEENRIMLRFARIFGQVYTRFLDLKKAEEQTKEAKIEASLEKVRGVALTLTKSDEMLDIAKVLYEQLLALGFTDIRNAIIDIHNDDTETFLDYDYSYDMSAAVTEFSFYGDPVIEQQIKKVQSGHDAFFEIELKGNQIKELIETRLLNGETDDPRLHQTDHLTYNLYSFGNGAIGISNFGILSDDQKKTLKRFRNVFTFAYKRYTDLANAEAQALEAKIEAALEKMRSVSLGLNKSEDMLLVAQALYDQLISLGFINIRNAIIDIDNDDGLTFSDYDYSDEMGGTVTQMSYKDDPTLKEQLEDIIATTDGSSEMVLEGQQLQDLIEMRRNNGEADDLRLMNTDSVSYVLYAFGKGAIGISNFGKLTEYQKTILNRFRNVFTFAYQRYTDLAQSEVQAAALLAEKQRLEVTLSDLQATQKQLIQSEKMASLGELTAGIAHEIQNPLNFVNNFSEVSNELIDEMKEELAIGNLQLAMEIASDIKQNLEKINHHGKRADSIVKGMLQHSRKSVDEKQPTDINALCDEYLRLAYHGLRAKDKSFNATLKTDFDESIGKVNVISQDIGRVVLNLISNAFYACAERTGKDLPGFTNLAKRSHAAKQVNLAGLETYEPTVSIITKKFEDRIEIHVGDNGNGIPANVLDKIFQPFFTTKPTGQGTGLGLSLSYDIVKAHGGELKVETREGEGTTFIIIIPT